MVNGEAAEIISARLPKGAVGVYEVVIALPARFATGQEARLQLVQNSSPSNIVTSPSKSRDKTNHASASLAPVLQQWIVFSTDRQNRPQMPANWCPFDPGSGKVPDHYDVTFTRTIFLDSGRMRIRLHR